MLKVVATVLFTAMVAAALSIDGARASHQEGAEVLKNNTCVRCHSNISSSSALTTRYLEWQLSAHGTNSVGCDKCHGGDPTAGDPKQAHQGVLAPTNPRSRLNDSTVPETCGACHKAIARSFVESAHYQKLKGSGMGPSCTTCHAHMASRVARNPSQGEALCTYCHNAVDGLLPQRPEIPGNSKAILDAIQRTEYVISWVNDLLVIAEKRHIGVDGEKKSLSTVKASLQGVKVAWHTFNLNGVLDMANGTFAQAVDIKDSLNKKLGRE